MTIYNGVLIENEDGRPWLVCGHCGNEFFAKVGQEVRYPDECPKCKEDYRRIHGGQTIESVIMKGMSLYFFAYKGREPMQDIGHVNNLYPHKP